MNKQEYEQKRAECWDALYNELLKGEVQWQPVSRKEIVNFVFDRAYALGKLQASCKQVKEAIMQGEIEKAAIEYVLTRQQARHNAKKEEDAAMRDFDKTIKAWDAYDMEQAFESGAILFFGRQEKDAEKSKEKLMCLRDRTKVCNRCHACDIDTDAWHSMYSR